ncbi:hypothetical protein [Macrococcus lamae]|uniref:hypothetical protein n=1 Tax=Macrococcus lamae TaxID=198484 RepID=UPI001408149B|nr:hypothetical protein [Macrococcus lamae]
MNINDLTREQLISLVEELQEENRALKEDAKLQEQDAHDTDDYRNALEKDE